MLGEGTGVVGFDHGQELQRGFHPGHSGGGAVRTVRAERGDEEFFTMPTCRRYVDTGEKGKEAARRVLIVG